MKHSRQTVVAFAGSGFVSGSSLVQHFGLGSATVADQIRIRWPSGAGSVLTAVPANQLMTVREPS